LRSYTFYFSTTYSTFTPGALLEQVIKVQNFNYISSQSNSNYVFLHCLHSSYNTHDVLHIYSRSTSGASLYKASILIKIYSNIVLYGLYSTYVKIAVHCNAFLCYFTSHAPHLLPEHFRSESLSPAHMWRKSFGHY
jgi:hypothetical protein